MNNRISRFPGTFRVSVYGNNWIMIWLMRKSAIRINREEVTTARMVDRATPSAPPVVLMP
jgi:hypothetical protein